MVCFFKFYYHGFLWCFRFWIVAVGKHYFHPDIAPMVEWTLKIKYNIYLTCSPLRVWSHHLMFTFCLMARPAQERIQIPINTEPTKDLIQVLAKLKKTLSSIYHHSINSTNVNQFNQSNKWIYLSLSNPHTFKPANSKALFLSTDTFGKTLDSKRDFCCCSSLVTFGKIQD